MKNNVVGAREGRSVNLCLVGLLDDIGEKLQVVVAQTRRRSRHISSKMSNLGACNKALSDKGSSFSFNVCFVCFYLFSSVFI